jgi:hypothetical protein
VEFIAVVGDFLDEGRDFRRRPKADVTFCTGGIFHEPSMIEESRSFDRTPHKRLDAAITTPYYDAQNSIGRIC